MLSAGWLKVDRYYLWYLGKENAKKFVGEMFNSGGRIGYHEYEYWLKWIENHLGGKEMKFYSDVYSAAEAAKKLAKRMQQEVYVFWEGEDGYLLGTEDDVDTFFEGQDPVVIAYSDGSFSN